MEKRCLSLFTCLIMVLSFIIYLPIDTNIEANAANTADSLVAIAKGELGSTNYKKYYGGNAGAWCADFVTWCAQQAGVSSIKYSSSCKVMYDGMKANGCQEVSSPQKGDIVFFYCSNCKGVANQWCHVGIMVDSKTSIDGNYGGKVSYDNSYSHYGSLGYKHSNGITKKYVRPKYNGDKPIVKSINVSQSKYMMNETVNIKIDASNYQEIWIGIDKDGKGRVVTKKVSANYSFSAKELGAGSYSAYATVRNQNGYTDTKRVYFTIDDKTPTVKSITTSKTLYTINENVNIKVDASNYQEVWLGIDKEGTGRVLTKLASADYYIPAKQLGVGNYSVYATVRNGNGYTDSKRIYFTITDKSQHINQYQYQNHYILLMKTLT